MMADYGSGGWGFESLAARHHHRSSAALSRDRCLPLDRRSATKLRPRWRALPVGLRPPATTNGHLPRTGLSPAGSRCYAVALRRATWQRHVAGTRRRLSRYSGRCGDAGRVACWMIKNARVAGRTTASATRRQPPVDPRRRPDRGCSSGVQPLRHPVPTGRFITGVVRCVTNRDPAVGVGPYSAGVQFDLSLVPRVSSKGGLPARVRASSQHSPSGYEVPYAFMREGTVLDPWVFLLCGRGREIVVAVEAGIGRMASLPTTFRGAQP